MNTEDFKPYIPGGAMVKIFGNTAVFEVPILNIKEVALDLSKNKNLPLLQITATDERHSAGCFKIWYVFGIPKQNLFLATFISLKDTQEFPSLTPIIHQAHSYERKINTFFGLLPVGHPDLRPLILHENWPSDMFPLRKDFNGQTRPSRAIETYQFQKVEGEGIYEIPVGPIHAGIIEPGHFRFSVAGEEIMLLEPRLGFTHKGSEKLFETLLLPEKLRLSEKISGDSSFSHSLAFCLALENLAGIEAPARANYLRIVYAELERVANHIGDIGFIMLDTGFNFGGAQCSRIREMVMQIHERLTDSRFLRGVNIIGGVTRDIDNSQKELLIGDIKKISKDFSEVMDVAQGSISLFNRLQGTGIAPLQVVLDYGVVGVPAKAVGIESDARVDFPYVAYKELGFEKVETEPDGDVYARFRVRVKEVYASLKLIQEALENQPEGPITTGTVPIEFKKDALAVSVVEGWRGNITYAVFTDKDGNISRVVPRDSSFLNWPAAGEVGAGNVVPDFPLINKSFNLSYTGNDL